MEENIVRFLHFFKKCEELAKRAYLAKRVHLLRMNTHPLAEMPVAK